MNAFVEVKTFWEVKTNSLDHCTVVKAPDFTRINVTCGLCFSALKQKVTA